MLADRHVADMDLGKHLPNTTFWGPTEKSGCIDRCSVDNTRIVISTESQSFWPSTRVATRCGGARPLATAGVRRQGIGPSIACSSVAGGMWVLWAGVPGRASL